MAIQQILGTETPEPGFGDELLEAAMRLLRRVGRGARQTKLGRLSRNQQIRMRALGINLGNNELSVSEFNQQMEFEIDIEHVVAAAIYRGSKLDQLTTQDKLLTLARIAGELGFLNRLVVQWQGGQVTQGRLAARSQMYGSAVRPTYYSVGGGDLADKGFTLERNLLSPVDNCEGAGSCIGETAKGLEPVGTLIPIGNRICLSNCQCRIEYINVQTEATVIL